LTAERWDELNEINRRVNRDIIAQVTTGNGVYLRVGDRAAGRRLQGLYHHQAPRTARARLALAGLLLSEVVVRSGEHHLILAVRTKDGDVVFDNLNANIRSVASIAHQHQWVRIDPAGSNVLGAGALSGDRADGDDCRQTR
jgi:hypothetical protein